MMSQTSNVKDTGHRHLPRNKSEEMSSTPVNGMIAPTFPPFTNQNTTSSAQKPNIASLYAAIDPSTRVANNANKSASLGKERIITKPPAPAYKTVDKNNMDVKRGIQGDSNRKTSSKSSFTMEDFVESIPVMLLSFFSVINSCSKILFLC